MTVMYHYVRHSEGTHCGVKAISPRAFGDQLDLLCRHFEPVRWPQLIRWLRGEGEIPRRSFLLTFDDGLKDHVHTAAAALETRGLRGVFLVSTQALVDRKPISAHLLHALLDRMSVDELAQGIDPCFAADGTCGASPEQTAAADAIYAYEASPLRYIKYLINYRMSMEDRYQLLTRLYAEHVGSIAAFVRHWYLTPEDAADLSRRGHTLGGHGHGHEPYLKLSMDQQIGDLRRCHDQITSVTLDDDIPFSFPFGSFDAEVIEHCRLEGFAGAFTTEKAPTRFSSDCYQLPRYDTIDVNTVMRNLTC